MKKVKHVYHLTAVWWEPGQRPDFGDDGWNIKDRLADQGVSFSEQWFEDEELVHREDLDDFLAIREESNEVQS